MKLDLHPAELVGVNLFATRSYDHRGLRTLDHRLACQPLRPERLLRSHCGEVGDIGIDLFAGEILVRLLHRQTVERRYDQVFPILVGSVRSEEHTSELQSLMRISYAVFCLKKKKRN